MSLPLVPDFSSHMSSNQGSNFGMGMNQYMQYPGMSSPNFQAPTSYTPQGGTPQGSTGGQNNALWDISSGQFKLPNGQGTTPTLDPSLTSAFGQYLQSMLGKGATPYTGTLNAPMDPLLQMSSQAYQTGNIPMSGVTNMLTQGALSGGQALPAWQSMLQAMQIPEQQDIANLKETFGAMGDPNSSAMATGMSQYLAQSTANKQSLLGQMEMQEQGTLGNLALGYGNMGLQELQQASGLGQTMQGINQQDLQNLYQEFLRTQPEYSPLLPMQQQFATTFPGLTAPQPTALQTVLGSAGGILGGTGSLLTGIGQV